MSHRCPKLFCLLMIICLPVMAAENPTIHPDSPDAFALKGTGLTEASGADWFNYAKFGMFIHWTTAAVPQNTWAELGINIPQDNRGDASWYFRRYQIPLATWKKLADRFNPQGFDAEQWVKAASDAGMRYIIYVSKHHDGFAMYDSAVSQYDIMDATPFKRDPLKELAAACRKYNLRLCLYYSHAQDWEHPGGVGNDWDYDKNSKNFTQYFEEKCKPQVRELLTNYGPIGLIWFDTPAVIKKEQTKELYDLVKSLQPNCLVNSRIGFGFGDYSIMGDSQFPETVMGGLWESASTTHIHWLYSDEDNKPRMDAAAMIHYLVGNVSRGGIATFNFGPDHNGQLTKPSLELLANVGQWMKHNNEAIYENGRTPYYVPFEWGTVTTRPGFLYLHVTRWPKDHRIELYGLTNPVIRASLLSETAALPIEQSYDAVADLHKLTITLPETVPDAIDSVIRIKYDRELAVQPYAVPQSGGMLRLEAAVIQGAKGEQGRGGQIIYPGYARAQLAEKGNHFKHTNRGGAFLEGWVNRGESVSWDAKIPSAGVYDVYLITSASIAIKDLTPEKMWEGGHEVTLSVGDARVEGVVSDEKLEGLPFGIVPENDRVCKLGQMTLPQAGTQTVKLELRKAAEKSKLGLTLRTVVLVPAK